MKLLALGGGYLAASLLAASFSQARAQTVEEIVVTAQRRAQNLQDVPITITAISGESLQNSGILGTNEIGQRVPGLAYREAGTGMQIFLRGVGSLTAPAGGENSVATYVDGVYFASMQGSMMQLASVDRIEVAKGPQGTLFGRNTTGGVVHIHTRDPEQEPSGTVRLGYGSFDSVSGNLYMTGGIAENLSADIAFDGKFMGDGYGTNIITGNDIQKVDSYILRSKWLYELTARDQIRLTFDFSRREGSTILSDRLLLPNEISTLPNGGVANFGPGNTTAGMRPDLAPYVSSGALGSNDEVGDPYVSQVTNFHDIEHNAFDPHFDFKQSGVSLQWDHEFDLVSLQSITAYRQDKHEQMWQATPIPAFRQFAGWTNDGDQFSQELQLSSLSSSELHWVVGAYYLNYETGYPVNDQEPRNGPFFIGGTTVNQAASLDDPFANLLTFTAAQSAEAIAIFGQVTYPVLEDTNLTLGLRYTNEERGLLGDIRIVNDGDVVAIVGATDQKKTFDNVIFRASLDHRFNDNLMAFGSFSQGFKSGLFNTIPPGGSAVDPEEIDAYEVGVKTDLLDNSLRLNVSGFYYDYTNLQTTVFDNISARLDNAAAAELYGLDMSVDWYPVERLSISSGLVWTHAEYSDYPLAPINVPLTLEQGGGTVQVSQSATGNRTILAPELVVNFGANYGVPLREDGEINFNANYSYNDGYFFDAGNTLRHPSTNLLNISIEWALSNGKTRLGVWAKNILDEEYFLQLSHSENPNGYSTGVAAPPATFGGYVSYDFF